MSDLERRLSDALRHGAEDAPPATGLAAAARDRARRQRRHRLVGVGAVVALAVGVPTAVAVSGDDTGRPAPADRSSVAVDPQGAEDDGLRWESWHDVTFQVPDTWGHGSLEGWCAGGGDASPRVERPPVVRNDILCSPASTYGVSVTPADGKDPEWPVVEQDSGGWPPHAHVGATTVADVIVEVVAADAVVAQAVLDSVRPIDGIDANGCPPDVTGAPVVPGDAMSVCRYDSTGALEQSELLSGSQVSAAEGALRATPPVDRGCLSIGRRGTVRLASVAEDAVVELAGCPALTVHGLPRELTADVLYWALSPGWSGESTGLPLPPELRQE